MGMPVDPSVEVSPVGVSVAPPERKMVGLTVCGDAVGSTSNRRDDVGAPVDPSVEDSPVGLSVASPERKTVGLTVGLREGTKDCPVDGGDTVGLVVGASSGPLVELAVSNEGNGVGLIVKASSGPLDGLVVVLGRGGSEGLFVRRLNGDVVGVAGSKAGSNVGDGVAPPEAREGSSLVSLGVSLAEEEESGFVTTATIAPTNTKATATRIRVPRRFLQQPPAKVEAEASSVSITGGGLRDLSCCKLLSSSATTCSFEYSYGKIGGDGGGDALPRNTSPDSMSSLVCADAVRPSV